MKKLVFSLLLLFSCVDGYSQLGIGFGIGGGGFGMGMRVPLNGNNGPQRSRNIEKKVQQMKKDLNLDDDQVIKVRGLLVERERRRNGSDAMTPKEFNQRLESILTPEQSNKLAELKQQKRQSKSQNSPDNGTNPPKPAPKNQDADDVYN